MDCFRSNGAFCYSPIPRDAPPATDRSPARAEIQRARESAALVDHMGGCSHARMSPILIPSTSAVSTPQLIEKLQGPGQDPEPCVNAALMLATKRYG